MISTKIRKNQQPTILVKIPNPKPTRFFMTRKNRFQERKLNSETFGIPVYTDNGGRFGYRGRGNFRNGGGYRGGNFRGGYRGNYRGGYRRNNNFRAQTEQNA